LSEDKLFEEGFELKAHGGPLVETILSVSLGYVEVAPAQIVYLDGASAKIGIFVDFGGILDTHLTSLVPC
jgi:hypothetical protein